MTPKHIGIIVDGNRRWAKRRGLVPWEGHRAGFKRAQELMEWSRELGIKEITFYGFSVQNFNRPAREVREIFRLIAETAKTLLKNPDIRKYRVRVRVIGRIHLFPKYVQVALARVVDETKDYDRYFINLALGYGGREEITDAVRAIAEDVKRGRIDPRKINEQTIQERLYLSSEPDMIIRTSGEQRTSNFLPWQATYSELYFTPKMFPEFSRADLVDAIKDYERRERRLGR